MAGIQVRCRPGCSGAADQPSAVQSPLTDYCVRPHVLLKGLVGVASINGRANEAARLLGSVSLRCCRKRLRSHAAPQPPGLASLTPPLAMRRSLQTSASAWQAEPAPKKVRGGRLSGGDGPNPPGRKPASVSTHSPAPLACRRLTKRQRPSPRQAASRQLRRAAQHQPQPRPPLVQRQAQVGQRRARPARRSWARRYSRA